MSHAPHLETDPFEREALETPMLVLAFVWLALLVIELIHGANALFETLGTMIWVIFILDFALELILAPRKLP
jgi:voltage-gated potassium channel